MPSGERFCLRCDDQRRKINLSQVFGRTKGESAKVSERIWLVTFMHYDLGYFGDETCRLEPIESPFGRECYRCLRVEL
jgi:putative transposase